MEAMPLFLFFLFLVLLPFFIAQGINNVRGLLGYAAAFVLADASLIYVARTSSIFAMDSFGAALGDAVLAVMVYIANLSAFTGVGTRGLILWMRARGYGERARGTAGTLGFLSIVLLAAAPFVWVHLMSPPPP